MNGPNVTPIFAALAASAALAAGVLACSVPPPKQDSAAKELARLQAQPKTQAECRPGLSEACYGGPDGTAGRGICREGQRTCDANGFWSGCDGEALPRAEACNGIDDDCDGIVDNGFERHGAICFRGQGACRSRGSWKCAPDGAKAECTAEIIPPSHEVCDGIDNDCDGEIDDGDLAGTGMLCSTGLAGVCAEGTNRCVKGKIQCVGNNQPSIEICNNRDDNCNNSTDEDCVSAEEAAKLLQK